MLGRKKPKRLYYPTRSRWYARPRRKPRASGAPRGKMMLHIRRRARDFVSRTLYVVIGAVFLLLVVGAFLLSTTFSISRFDVGRENFNVDIQEITAELRPYIGRSIFLFRKQDAVQVIQNKFPEYASVRVKKILPDTLSIELASHPIVANVRAYYLLPEPEEELSQEDERVKEVQESIKQVFTLDEREEAPPEPVEQKALLNRAGQAIFDQDEDLSLITVIVEGLTQPIEDREIVIPRQHMDLILDSVDYFNSQLENQVQSVQYYPIGRELHLRATNGLVVWLALERDIRKQIDKLISIYGAAGLDKEDISYIDLRVDEKVIYCPRGTVCDK